MILGKIELIQQGEIDRLKNMIDNSKPVLQSNDFTIKLQKYGYLRKDQDGHWYLVPVELLSDWDKIESQQLPDFYCHTGEDFEDLYERALMEFDGCRLKGGIQDLKVIIE
jgi:hypothetical protein